MRFPLFIFLFAVLPASGATITAASAERTNVVAAITASSDGDTVVIPTGSAHWTTNVSITKAITLQGMGTNSTVIYDDIPQELNLQGTIAQLINVVTVSNKSYRITGIQFAKTSTRTTPIFEGQVHFDGSSRSIRVDHCLFNETEQRKRFIEMYGSSCGVIDHNYFVMTDTQGITTFHNEWGGPAFGDISWASPTALGTTNVVCIEDNIFTNATVGKATTDGYAGARYVFRYNKCYNAHFDTHGTESGGRYRGTRSIEVYNNTFTNTSMASLAMSVRSGTGVVWGNSCSNVQFLCYLYDYRMVEPDSPWGGADGTNVWDNNQVGSLFTGTHTGTNNSLLYLVDTNQNWTPGILIGDTVQNQSQVLFNPVVTNTATTITLQSSQGLIADTRFTNGNAYAIYHVVASLDMPGMGECSTLVTGSPPTPAGWPNQAIEPIYGWGNKQNGGSDTGGIYPGYDVMVAGIHFTNGIGMPGYTPLIYPHPLVTAQDGGTTNSVTYAPLFSGSGSFILR